MPGQGKPGDPLWFAIGLVSGVIPGLYFHQIWAGVAVGLVLGGAFGLIREDKRRGLHRPADPLRFGVGFLIGFTIGISLRFLGLSWGLSIFAGAALGVVFGAVAGTARADRRRAEEQEDRELAKRYRNN